MQQGVEEKEMKSTKYLASRPVLSRRIEDDGEAQVKGNLHHVLPSYRLLPLPSYSAIFAKLIR